MARDISKIVDDLEGLRESCVGKSPGELKDILPNGEQLNKLNRLVREINDYSLFVNSYFLTQKYGHSK
ncbi:MAG: hypothetical protein A2259_02755 [Candidatus Moranbacteria bacterium RIFOXYA2_FULL_43_15]|nr:MAG: hypothetical protein A2259_02755 [Candidatus Moranbacteria bacterium RIFOXYA2_FULL_43_15]